MFHIQHYNDLYKVSFHTQIRRNTDQREGTLTLGSHRLTLSTTEKPSGRSQAEDPRYRLILKIHTR